MFQVVAEVVRSSWFGVGGSVKFTRYFQKIRRRPDRAIIKLDWKRNRKIHDEWRRVLWKRWRRMECYIMDMPVKESIQADGRIRLWAPIKEMQGKYLSCSIILYQNAG